MNKIEELFGDVSGKEIVVIVELFEFWSMEAIEGKISLFHIKRYNLSIFKPCWLPLLNEKHPIIYLNLKMQYFPEKKIRIQINAQLKMI